MKLYAFYTPSHEVFYQEWFLPSLMGEYELIVKRYEQKSSSGDFMKGGWIETMQAKADTIIEGIRDNMGETIVHADVDIQFFKPTAQILSELIKGKDLVIQRDTPKGGACAGFFACKANEKTLCLWKDIKKNLGKNNYNDQDLLNFFLWESNSRIARTLFAVKNKIRSFFTKRAFYPENTRRRNPYDIRWAYLPDQFMSGGMSSGKLWEPGRILEIPEDIVLHHANFTVGIENKIAQLKYVRDQWSAGRSKTTIVKRA